MDAMIRTLLWKQMGAAIDMLEHVITACPADLWDNGEHFWYTAYHTLFYLDYYLTEDPEGFLPPRPFTLSEFDPGGQLPERTYTSQELVAYLAHCREKCHALTGRMTDALAAKRFVNPYRDYSILELFLYNMRHVQHHTGQLQLLLRRHGLEPPRWVAQAAGEWR